MSKFTRAFKYPQPHQEVGLSGKRRTVGNNVKTANEEPPHIRFYFHNEYGRSAHFPGVLFFNSQIVPEEGTRIPSPGPRGPVHELLADTAVGDE